MPAARGVSAPLRRVVARAGRDRTFTRTFPAEFGNARFRASTEGGLKFLRRDVLRIDPPLIAFARRSVTSGSRVWDVGANVGYFSFAAAGLAGADGRVLALEPDTWLAANLRASARRNAGAVAPVEVLPVALGATAGVSRFYISAQNRACNNVDGRGNAQVSGSRDRQLVPTTTLDALLESFEPPAVVKIDVENAELAVLAGGPRLLAEVRPVLLVEFSGASQAAGTHLLHDAGYALFDGETAAPTSVASWLTVAIPSPDV